MEKRLMAMIVVIWTTICAYAANINWVVSPSSVKVGDTFYVYAYYNSTRVSVSVDESASSGKVWEWDAADQYKAASAGNVTFYFQYYVGSQRYESSKVVRIQGASNPSQPTLGTVSISLSSSSAVPGDNVSCSLNAYSTTGELITSGSKSWRISSITNDSISSSGVVTIAPIPLSRNITVVGSYTYGGNAKSATATITVVPILYTIIFDPNGGQHSSLNESLTAALGCELPDCISIPQKEGYVFVGWSTDTEGRTMWYDFDGNKQIAAYTTTGDTTLYAVWKPLYPVFTPESGTVFEDSLSVSISCLAEGATIHYTTDGSEPTIDSPVYRRFRINGKTTVKAIAEENGLLSEVVTAEYALGRCEDPIITPGDGATFEWAGEQVSIGKQGDEGVLRYTTDGSEPTRESPVYDGPFAISDSTVVKAKMFSDKFFDSAVVTVNITRVWTDVAKPKIEALNSFIGSKTRVVMSCSTERAVIHYTLDGGEPNSHSTKYTGPFYVSSSCTVKAYARKQDYRDSSVAVHEIVKVWGIGDAMGKPDHGFTTSGAGGLGWTRVADATAPNGEAMKSGAIAHKQSSLLETKVMGPGTLTFSWRTSCEDSGGYYDWDHVEVSVDGEVRLKRDGINTWAAESIRIEGDGEHTVMWAYIKDDVESAGDDAAYVAGYGWVSDYTETKTTQVPVPYAWLKQCDSEIVDEFDAYESAALAMAKNGLNKVWECYVAGISPTNAESRFTAKIEFKDGAPIVTWKPDLNTNGIVRTYKIYGSETLENGGEWQYPTNSLHRFFKVTVEMP